MAESPCACPRVLRVYEQDRWLCYLCGREFRPLENDGTVRLAEEWREVADELEKSAQSLEIHAENIRRRARIAREVADQDDGWGVTHPTDEDLGIG